MTTARRDIPRTDDLLDTPELARAADRLGRPLVKAAVVAAQQRARDGELAPHEVGAAALAALPRTASSLRRVINATGVVVHTNLGRAPLSAAAVAAVVEAAGCSDVEYDLAGGRRGPRGAGAIQALLDAVPAAPAAHVVNNNAAALLLCALALAGGREIVISRGELVEIGDGFRIPDLLASTGARLREVGTTNRTSLGDYADAIGQDTGFVLKVHPSNFLVTGFTSAVPVRELAGLDAPLVVDVGSGLLTPDRALPDEPDVDTALRAGATLVTASADKLLGGPQAGLLFGHEPVVRRLRRRVPVMLHADRGLLVARAEALAATVTAGGVAAIAVPCESAVGGGGAPGLSLPSAAVSLPVAFAAALRATEPPVIGRVERDRCLLDLRTVDPADEPLLLAAINQAAILQAARRDTEQCTW